MAPSKLNKDLITLATAVSNTKVLIRAFQSPNPSTTLPNLSLSSALNPLAVILDSSKILKAQTTKLSLLLLNKPFTPNEIAHILNALGNSCLPALATVPDLCPGERYTDFLRQHINGCLSSIWRELLTLVDSIPREQEGVKKLEKEGTLLSTGVLWATCDKLLRVGSEGVAIVGSDAVKGSQALFQDAIDELDEWDPENDEDDDDDENSAPAVNTPTTSDDEALAGGMQHISLNPMIALKAQALKHMRLVRLLYPALIKHRVKTFTNIKCNTTEADLPSNSNARLFDHIIRETQSFTEEADEIAGALYSSGTEEVNRRLKVLMEKARACTSFSKLGYDGKEDAFSEWAQKWIARSEELGT